MFVKGFQQKLDQQKSSITWCDLFQPNFGKKTPKIISVHDVWEPLKQVLWASRDVIISSQIFGSNVQRLFTLGDGCWLRIGAKFSKKALPYPHQDPRIPIRNQEKGVLAKGFCGVQCHAQGNKKYPRGHWAQQYVWHSEHHSQERRIFWPKTLLKVRLQRKCSCGIMFVIITKIITKIILPRNYFIIISARMVVLFSAVNQA